MLPVPAPLNPSKDQLPHLRLQSCSPLLRRLWRSWLSNPLRFCCQPRPFGTKEHRSERWEPKCYQRIPTYIKATGTFVVECRICRVATCPSHAQPLPKTFPAVLEVVEVVEVVVVVVVVVVAAELAVARQAETEMPSAQRAMLDRKAWTLMA